MENATMKIYRPGHEDKAIEVHLTREGWLVEAKEAMVEVLTKGMIKNVSIKYLPKDVAQIHIVGLLSNARAKEAARDLVELLNETAHGGAKVDQVLMPELE